MRTLLSVSEDCKKSTWPAPAPHHSTRQWLARSEMVLPPSGLSRMKEFSPVIMGSLGSTGGIGSPFENWAGPGFRETIVEMAGRSKPRARWGRRLLLVLFFAFATWVVWELATWPDVARLASERPISTAFIDHYRA